MRGNQTPRQDVHFQEIPTDTCFGTVSSWGLSEDVFGEFSESLLPRPTPTFLQHRLVGGAPAIVGSAHESTPWRAVQRAACEAIRNPKAA